MSRVKVYEKPTCTTCRKMITLLREKGIDFDRIDYFIEEFTARNSRNFSRKQVSGRLKLCAKRIHRSKSTTSPRR